MTALLRFVAIFRVRMKPSKLLESDDNDQECLARMAVPCHRCKQLRLYTETIFDRRMSCDGPDEDALMEVLQRESDVRLAADAEVDAGFLAMMRPSRQ